VLWQVQPSGEVPIYRQLMRQVEEAIASGRLATGDRLPSHRELAEQLVVAPLTVKKAYDELERAGLITTQQGRGTFVSARAAAASRPERIERLREPVRRLVGQALLAGLATDDLHRLIDAAARDWARERKQSARRR